MTRHLLVAHGSPDPRHRDTMLLLAKSIDSSGPRCEVAFIEHDEPRLDHWLAAQTETTRLVTLGMLLAPGYHATVDVPGMLGAAPPTVTVDDRGPLGVGPWLNRTLDWLVADAEGSSESTVVLAVAGSARTRAQRSLSAFAAQWQGTRSGQVLVAAATGPGTSLEDVVTALRSRRSDPVVLPLMIAPGVLADRARKVAASRGFRTTGTLAESPDFSDVVRQRLTG